MAPSTSYTQLLRRDSPDSNDSNKITPVIITGFVVAGVVVAVVIGWLFVRLLRKRNVKKRKEERSGAFLTVKGVVKDGQESLPSVSIGSAANDFSRTQMGPSIVMPNKAIINPNATKDDIIRYHTEAGNITRPFSFALKPPRILGHSPSNSTNSRPVSTVSFLTADRSSPRTSMFGLDWRSSSISAFSSSSTSRGVESRKVRQLFNPVLPDELVINLEEKITVVQSFDDGWCIVGRDSMLKSGDVEMGAVPAWVFVKPVKGLKAERPMRSSSLGVTVEMDAGPGFSSREELVSWSNF
ncbi:hypothetical protein HETIRDRAFT_383186 [Heterobasidion irregulare TC 32-1]|uniref:SH3 domain-containing protein n=1 Tax=Heterobasidion irregulare (strain TC 32-1) TaxID=747525 RepID=W4KBK1_HETIT|nr:uncharacterized protein HETIRDRAFT_383186 [Heterobasidion irregulare TC 32-1]ETW83109.1 hypothetical protein HETIRDRAFT_383186 [Heterobasidion irregulare TC 32-1]